MAEKTLNTRQKQKYDTSTNWATNNIVLLAGEIGIESDTNKFKVGNGTSAWNELDYAGGSETILYPTTGQNTDGAMTQKAVSDALPQAVTVSLSSEQTINDITITQEQFNILLASPENYIVIDWGGIPLYNELAMVYRRMNYVSMEESSGVTIDMLVFGMVSADAILSSAVARDINYLKVVRASMNGEVIIQAEVLMKEIPSTLADLTEDSTHRTVTDSEKNTWNAKSDFSGSYNDLTDKPTIPTINVNGTPQSTLNFDSDPQTQITQNTQDIEDLQNGKVDKVAGKQLSTENFTTAEKNKLAGLNNYDDTQVKAEITDLQTADEQNVKISGQQDIDGEKTFHNITRFVNEVWAFPESQGNRIDIISTGQDFVKYGNGILICWGEEINVNNNTTTTLPNPYKDNSYKVIAVQSNISSGWSDNIKVFNKSNSNFQVNTGGRTNYMWMSIGYWR